MKEHGSQLRRQTRNKCDKKRLRSKVLQRVEERLANASANGETADCTDLLGDDKKIKGDVLSWLCTSLQASARVTDRGVSIMGAQIQGTVNLEWAKISFPLVAEVCVFKGAVLLSHSNVAFLILQGGCLKNLNAN